MAASNDPQREGTPRDAEPTSRLDPEAVARIVNVAWCVTRDRLARESRSWNDWSGYFIDHPDRVA